MSAEPTLARKTWRTLEPIHGMVYFVPEADESYAALGIEPGSRMGYFVSRAAEEASTRPQGRPLFAAHAALAWPEEPHLVLWHAQTLLREFRGDAHVAALLTEGLTGEDGCARLREIGRGLSRAIVDAGMLVPASRS